MVRLYTVFDKVAKEHSPLMEAKNDDVARRYFLEYIRKVSDPENFDLCFVGEITRSDDKIDIRSVPLDYIVIGSELMKDVKK